MVTNEEEVIRALPQPAKIAYWGDVPSKDVTKDFRRNADGYVQQRVSSAFEVGDVSGALLDLLFQRQYGIDVDFWTHAGRANVCQVREMR